MNRSNEDLGVLQYMLMLQELHKRGFQKLRWMSYMSPNGCAMRCHITTEDNLWDNVEIKEFNKAWITSTSNDDSGVYDIEPYMHDFMCELGVELLETGRGKDTEYVKWYDKIMEYAQKGKFPTYQGEFWDAPKGMIRVGEDVVPVPPIGRNVNLRSLR